MDFRAELKAAGGRHADGVGEDRLGPREVHDGREDLRGLEDAERETGLLRLDRGGDPGNASADDRDIEAVGPLRLVESGFGEDRPYGAGPRVRCELEERDS